MVVAVIDHLLVHVKTFALPSIVKLPVTSPPANVTVLAVCHLLALAAFPLVPTAASSAPASVYVCDDMVVAIISNSGCQRDVGTAIDRHVASQVSGQG